MTEEEEEEEKLARLEKRLVANVDFDVQAVNILGFDTDIYYMLGHLGWVQFSNGVLVLTVDYRIKVRLDLQADKSSVVVKGPFFP
jgi:hypothetical protein